MSQAKASREFKFVGAYCRKRRRRNGHLLTTEPGWPVTAAANTQTAHDSTMRPAIAAESRHATDEREPLGTEPITMVCSTANQTADVPDLPSSAPRIHQPHTNTVHEGADTGSLHEVLRDEADWAFSRLMNPFLEADPLFITSIDQPNHHLQLQFGTDMPALQLDDTSLSSNSPIDDLLAHETHGEGNEETSGSPVADELVLPSISSRETPSNITSTITQLLSRYDREFCVLPLTCDFDANPFRSHPEYGQNSQLLHHCILALSYKHINRDNGTCDTEARLHKRMALRMLKDMEGSSRSTIGTPSCEATFLDAILILMTLDCATSARGPWAWYLKRAYKMMQVMESLNVPKTPRMQARVEILVWWDVTLALTTRQGCVLSESTMISLLDRDQASTQTFYSVSGCPEALFRRMIRLGSYAREYELVARMTCARFDLSPVLVLEKEIREWSDTEYEGPSDQQAFDSLQENSGTEDLAHYKEDLHHCAEAWRWGLLIYVVRVFRWERDKPAPQILDFLARKTLNHVSSCRCTSMVQKQLLLPVFLAGCETKDEHLRQIARSYCSWWNEWTRYAMFLTANALLEEIWKTEDSQEWWGSVIDKKNTSNQSNHQFLFG